jgi:hypothetical protein
MASPSDSTLSPLVRFPNFTDLGDLNSLSIIVQDLSTIYDVTSVAVLPGYERVLMPSTRLGPRRLSPLRGEDRLPIKNVSFSSPLEIVFWVMSASGAVGVAATGADRVARAVKAWLDVLIAGVDLQQRRQALEQSRRLAPYQLEEAELRKALMQQQLQRVTAPPEFGPVEEARAELRDSNYEPRLREWYDPAPEPRRDRGRSFRRPAGSMSNLEFAELLDEPMNRLLGYAGGEVEVAGNQGTLF